MRRTILFAIVSVLAMLLLLASPAGAITDGQLDGDGHPAVVLILMEVNGQPAFRCSGTLLSPTIVVTAGHCTGAPGEFSGMRIFTESDVDAGKLNGTNNYPYGGGAFSVEAAAWHTHPLYTSDLFYMHDVGVIELAAPVYLPAGKTYGALPTVDQLDALRRKDRPTFTSVGYGRQLSFPLAASWKNEAARVRMVAYPKLDQINAPGMTGDYSMLLSNNAATGGTCFGDSGGPNFLGSSNVIAAVTSYGLNDTCGGVGGVFRLDRQNVLDFIDLYL